MKKIMIPIDGSEFSDRAIEQGRLLAKTNESEIILLHVVDMEIPDFVEFSATNLSSAPSKSFQHVVEKKGTELLNAAREKFGDLQSRVSIQIAEKINNGNVAITIVHVAEQENVDLLIMGSEGVGSSAGLKSFFLGSVTNRVLHNTKIPLMIVK